MQNIPTKVDGSTTLPAAEFNQIPDELENAITDSGQTLDIGTLDQVSKAMAIYAGGGDYYTDSGAADAYTLTAIGSKKAPIAYFVGMTVRFIPDNANTGASTIDVALLGPKNIKLLDGSTDPAANDIPADFEIQLTYDGTNFRITSKASSNNLATPTASKHGALLYQNDADNGYTALTALGTTGQVLTSNGDDAAPSYQDAGGGAWNLLETQTASSSPTIDFTTGIDSTYVNYKIICSTVIPATDAQTFSIQFSTNGGSTYLTGVVDRVLAQPSDSTYDGATSDSVNSANLIENTGTGTGENASGEITIFNPSNATVYKNINSDFTAFNAGGANQMGRGAITVKTTSAINAVRLSFASGNIASGTFKLYGIL